MSFPSRTKRPWRAIGAPAGAERGPGAPASDGDRGPRRACFARWGGGGGSRRGEAPIEGAPKAAPRRTGRAPASDRDGTPCPTPLRRARPRRAIPRIGASPRRTPPPPPQRPKHARRGPRSPSLAGAPVPRSARRARLRRAHGPLRFGGNDHQNSLSRAPTSEGRGSGRAVGAIGRDVADAAEQLDGQSAQRCRPGNANAT